MIYGDNPQKINERQDALGTTLYSYRPQVTAIIQSGNLYVYGLNNPVTYSDPTGNFFVTTATLITAGSILIFGTVGGWIGGRIADTNGATGWEKALYVGAGTLVGGIGGYALATAAVPTTATTATLTSIANASPIVTSDVLLNAKLYEACYGHIFSQDHVDKGIMNLGNGTIDIFNKIYAISNSCSSQWAEGTNEIRTVFNGIETTMRFFVRNGEIIKINAFVEYSNRVIGNLIQLIP